jgi:hypothetical protein
MPKQKDDIGMGLRICPWRKLMVASGEAGQNEKLCHGWTTFHPDAAAMGVDEALDDGQAQAAFHPSAFAPGQQFKQVGLVLERNPGALVVH